MTDQEGARSEDDIPTGVGPLEELAAQIKAGGGVSARIVESMGLDTMGATFDQLAARMDEFRVRRDIARALLGPETPPDPPTRVWTEAEAVRFLPPGRIVRRCLSLPREDDTRSRPWPDGPWDAEPDLLEWRSPMLRSPLLAVLGTLGAWCGYAAAPRGAKYYGADWMALERANAVDVHGGLTYADRPCERISHRPSPSEPEDVWWFGFDCAHCYDLVPGLAVRAYDGRAAGFRADAYRDLLWLVDEIESLAGQLEHADDISRARRERALFRAIRHRCRLQRRDLRRARRGVAS